MTVLSGLLKSSADTRQHSVDRTKASISSTTDRRASSVSVSSTYDSSTYLADETQLVTEHAEPPDLRELNNSLAALADIFPDVQVEVFREMLASFDKESRLAVITETLLKHQMKWVKGRYRVSANTAAAGKDGSDASRGKVRKEDRFRSDEYKTAVKALAYHEFKGLSHSTIKAVFAEHNYSYILSRPTLIALNSKTWRFSISSMFSRRKEPSLTDDGYPLVVWHSTSRGSIIPSLKTTGNAELDRELFDAFVVPLQIKYRAEQIEKDYTIAVELNNNEATESEALHDCECCFMSSTFENLSACDEDGHFICFQCVRHAINEAVFGQGWARNINHESGTLRCIASVSNECKGCVPRTFIQRALIQEKGGEDIQRKLDERLTEDNLLKCNVPLVRCPFCSYAEIDELYLPNSQQSWQFRTNRSFPFFSILALVLGVSTIPFLLPFFIVLSFFFLLLNTQRSFTDFIRSCFQDSLARTRRRKLGLRFTCQNPACRLSSCISCSKAWSDIHICHESSLLALRTQVELAMSLAVKRTCPRCNTSFVKLSGCNKLTCVCGYQMCYVCRKNIGNGEGYRHFCEHFRPNGGRGCSACDKCDLYRCEDDEVAVQKAKANAEKAWLETEGISEEGADGVGKAWLETLRPKQNTWWSCPNLDWEKVVDRVVEAFIE